MVKFCVDRFVNGRPYPNLAQWQADPYTDRWQKFSVNWPYSEPVHFFEYLNLCNIQYSFVSAADADRNTLYPISISFFDFGVDWFRLLPPTVIEKLQSNSITIWFYYSEGDNPQRIRNHLVSQADQHGISMSCVQFVSANSGADSVPGFHFFADDECLYQLRNQHAPIQYHSMPRRKKFTVLSRTHKWWRATTMARFWQQKLHNCSYFSYNNIITVNEEEDDNPIEIDSFENLRNITYDFLNHCPFVCDELTSDQHNLYATTVENFFADSYVNVILETHLDTDQSLGAFLTEKTFKPIKNSQPFVIIGAPGSVAQLKKLGYRTFDHVIDHSYDSVVNNTQRWDTACKEVERLATTDLHNLYQQCRDDLIWNQNLFLQSKINRLNSLLTKTLKYAITS